MIEIHRLSIHCGSFALTDLSLSIAGGSYSVLMGGTGQGKTICGLRPITSGRVVVNGIDVTRLKPADRNIGYVPQDLALFPTMTVREHLEFALRLRRCPAAFIRERVAELAQVLQIEPLLARRTRGLSGGESQRVALGRALSFHPRVLLLDEPLTALDEQTRDRLCELLRTVQRDQGLTILHVTHGRAEARQLADRLLVLDQGRLHERHVADLGELTNAPPMATMQDTPGS
jgi:ABC-type sugar transport system ATPase subunit